MLYLAGASLGELRHRWGRDPRPFLDLLALAGGGADLTLVDAWDDEPHAPRRVLAGSGAGAMVALARCRCYAPGARPRPVGGGSGGGPTTNAPAAAPVWEARPAAGPPGGAVRWGVVHRPTGRWAAFGSEARCRALAAHLTEVDAILTRPPPPAGGGRPAGVASPPAAGHGAEQGGRRDGLRARGATRVFRAALWLGGLLTAALVAVLTTPAGADAEGAAAYHTLLWVLWVWTALAWAVAVVVGLRVLRRR